MEDDSNNSIPVDDFTESVSNGGNDTLFVFERVFHREYCVKVFTELYN